MKHKIKTTFEYLPSDQSMPMYLGEGDEEEEREPPSNSEEESIDFDDSEIPFLDLNKPHKKKLNLYSRKTKKIDIDDTTENENNHQIFNTHHSELNADFSEDKLHNVNTKFIKPPKGVEPPPE